jgi:autotransporter-associated beta strand protein
LGASTGYYRFYGSLGSSAAAFDLGTSTATMMNRNGGTTIQLGSLAGSSGTTLTGASSVNAPTTYSIGGNNNNTTFSGKITDNDGTTAILKTGSGTWTITGASTFSGGTTISAGTLLVNNTSGSGTGSGAVAVNNGGTLAGTGIFSGSVTVNSGGTLAPGNALGTLTISNALTLMSGGTTFVKVEHTPLTNSAVKVSGTFTEGGTLNVTNFNATTFVVGDSFKLFNAGSYSGAFTSFVLPSLSGNLVWNTYGLNVSGTLSVVTLSSPTVGSVKLSNGNLVISGTGGTANWPYYVLVTTNLVSPQWVPVATNQFDASGNFIFTNVINASTPQSFYQLQLP